MIINTSFSLVHFSVWIMELLVVYLWVNKCGIVVCSRYDKHTEGLEVMWGKTCFQLQVFSKSEAHVLSEARQGERGWMMAMASIHSWTKQCCYCDWATNNSCVNFYFCRLLFLSFCAPRQTFQRGTKPQLPNCFYLLSWDSLRDMLSVQVQTERRERLFQSPPFKEEWQQTRLSNISAFSLFMYCTIFHLVSKSLSFYMTIMAIFYYKKLNK